jgi:cell wall-associated NlpC family hydrolase
MPSLDALILAARRYLGVPFRHAGRTDQGVDCVGLILAAARDAGLFDYRPKPYPRGDASKLTAEIERFAERVAGPPEPGDLLLLRVRGELTHVALVTDEGTILHAHERLGRVVEQQLTDAMMARVGVTYRFRSERVVTDPVAARRQLPVPRPQK